MRDLQRVVPMLHPVGSGLGVPIVLGHLELGLARTGDGPAHPLDDAELAAMGQPVGDLIASAIWNLRRATHGSALVPLDTLPGMSKVIAPDGLAASRMLCIRDLIQPWPLEGVVACCPQPDQLLLVPLDGLQALPALQALLRIASDTHRSVGPVLSDQLHWCEDGDDWVALDVVHGLDRIDLAPEPAFVAALERVMAVHLVPEAAEA